MSAMTAASRPSLRPAASGLAPSRVHYRPCHRGLRVAVLACLAVLFVLHQLQCRHCHVADLLTGPVTSHRTSRGEGPRQAAACQPAASQSANRTSGAFATLRPSPDWAAPAKEWETSRLCSDEMDSLLLPQASPWTLVWTEEAEALVIAALQQNQFPEVCSERTWLAAPMWDCGLLSTFHVFAAELVFAVAVGWTAVPVANEYNPAFDGCPTGLRHLGCFFNATSCAFTGRDDDPRSRELNRTKRVAWDDLDPTNVAQGSLVWPESGKPTLKKGPWRRRVDAWFKAMWQQMMDGNMVTTYGGMKPELTEESRKEFLIMSIVTKWLFNPHPRIPRLAETILRKYTPSPSNTFHGANTNPFVSFFRTVHPKASATPTRRQLAEVPPVRSSNWEGRGWTSPALALHIRQTDKMMEDPYWKKFERYRPTPEYVRAIRMLERQQGFDWSTLLLMSDSESAMHEYLDDPQHVGLGDGMTIIHDHTFSIALEEYRTHARVHGDLKKKMQDHFLAMLYLVSELADYAVFTMSSNIGRFILECIGARKRMEQTSGFGPIGLSMDGENFRWWSEYSK